MNSRELYCANCGTHTLHQDLPAVYATRCTVCNAQTPTIMRAQADAAALATQRPLTAPDGTPGKIVENTPKKVVFFVDSGPHRGYYHYDKQKQTYAIVAA